MSSIAVILNDKGSDVFTIAGSATVFEAISQMADKGVGCLVVMGGETILGIVTERDYLRKVILQGRSSKTTPITEIMSSKLVVASPEDSIEYCMGVMTEKHIRHLPVVKGSKLVGLVSVGDLVKQVSRDQKAEIRYLTDYISGKYPG